MTTESIYTDPYPLDTILEPMKPFKPNMDKPSHVAKLDIALADYSEYAVEEKLDGCHYFMINNRFFSTRISDVTGTPVEKTLNFPHLLEIIQEAGIGDTILDGEICLPGLKSQDVVAITGSLPEAAIAKQNDELGYVQYRVFDMLRTPGGKWITDLSWLRRRFLIEKLFEQHLSGQKDIVLNDYQLQNKKAFLDDLINKGAEGVVLKHVAMTYECGKRPAWNWIKVKQSDTDDAIIIGFEPATREYTGKAPETWQWWEDDVPVTKYWAMGLYGAMILGKYGPRGEMVRVGTCSGMTELQRAKFTERPNDYIGKVVQIKMMERTNDGFYRHPSFVQMHPDKNPEECVI